MSAVGSFFGEFGLDIDPFLKSVRDIEREAKSIEGSLKPLTKAAEDLGKTFAAAGAAITATLSIAVKQSAAYGESLNKVSIQTGIATEKLSALKYIADQEETSFEALELGLKKMSVTATQNAAAFEGLGVKVKESNGQMRPQIDLLTDVAKRFASMHDETKRTALEVEVFGRSGSDLNELLLRIGREGLGPATLAVQRFGTEMSGEAAKASDDFNDSIKEIEQSLLGLSNAVAHALLPALTDESHSLRDSIIGIKDFAKEHENLTKAIAYTGLALTAGGGLLFGLGEIVSRAPAVVAGLRAITAGITALGAEAVISTAGLAALAYWWYKLDEAEAEKAKNSEKLFDSQRNSIIQTQENAKALAKIGVVLEQGSQDWKTYADNVKVAMALHASELPKPVKPPSLDELFRTQKEVEEAAKKAAEAQKENDKILAANAQEFIDRHKEMVSQSDKLMDEFWKKREQDQRDDDELGRAAAQDFIDEHKRAVGESDKAMDEFWKKREQDWKDDIELQQAAAADFIAEHKHMVAESDKAMDEFWQKRETDRRKADEQLKRSIDEVKKSAGAIFDDMFVKGESVFMSLHNMLKGGVLSLGRAIFDDISGALLGPVLNLFKNFINNTIKGLLGGLGNSIGGAIGGALGIGGSAASKAAAGAAGVAGTAGTTAGISGASLLAFATNPFTIGIAAAGAAAIAIAHFVGGGRKKADEFVSSVQNPFGSSLAGVINPFEALKAAGKLTLDQATKARDALTDLWNNFVSTAKQFATQGKNQAKVVSQAFETMTQNFGPGLSNLFTEIDSTVADLTKQAQAAAPQVASAAATATATAGIPDTGRAVSASTIFANAVDKLVDNGGKPGGVQTIALNVTTAPVFDIKVDNADIGFQVRDEILPKIISELSLGMNTATAKLVQIIKQNWGGVVTTGGAVA